MTVMLYRPGSEPNPQVWDRFIEHAVFSEGEVEQALAESWARHPDELLTGDVQTSDEPPKRRGRPPKVA